MSRSAFITGGSGFIGARLIKRLLADGWTVKALSRSGSSDEQLLDAGAEPVRGDLADRNAMASAVDGCTLVFHAAAHLGEWGRREQFLHVNVEGTRNVLAAAAGAGVRRFVHVGTEAALIAGRPLVGVDEAAPLRPDSKALYPATKAMAEQLVREANSADLETVVVRPRLVWGLGDGTVLPALLDAIEQGKFAWIGGGRHLTSTTHVDNAVEGLVLAAAKGKPGSAYFVTDGEPVVFREFIGELIETQGVRPPSRSVPPPVAHAAAVACEGIWRALRLKSTPPLTRFAYWLSAQECTIDITRAREELGYRPVKSVEEGMAELRTAHTGTETHLQAAS